MDKQDKIELIGTMEHIFGTQKEVARFFGVSPRAVRYWKTSGGLSKKNQAKAERVAERPFLYAQRTTGQREYIASQLGVKRATVDKWIRGESIPNTENRDKIDALGRTGRITTFSEPIETTTEPYHNAQYQEYVEITRGNGLGEKFFGRPYSKGDTQRRDQSRNDAWDNYRTIAQRYLNADVSKRNVRFGTTYRFNYLTG